MRSKAARDDIADGDVVGDMPGLHLGFPLGTRSGQRGGGGAAAVGAHHHPHSDSRRRVPLGGHAVAARGGLHEKTDQGDADEGADRHVLRVHGRDTEAQKGQTGRG